MFVLKGENGYLAVKANQVTFGPRLSNAFVLDYEGAEQLREALCLIGFDLEIVSNSKIIKMM